MSNQSSQSTHSSELSSTDISDVMISTWKHNFEIQAGLRINYICETGNLMSSTNSWNNILHQLELYSVHFIDRMIHEIYIWRLSTIFTISLSNSYNLNAPPLPTPTNDIIERLNNSNIENLFMDVVSYSNYTKYFPESLNTSLASNYKDIKEIFYNNKLNRQNRSLLDPYKLSYLSIDIVFCQVLLIILRVLVRNKNILLDDLLLLSIDNDFTDYILKEYPSHHNIKISFWQKLLRTSNELNYSSNNISLIQNEIFCSNILFSLWSEIYGTLSSFKCGNCSSKIIANCSRLESSFKRVHDIIYGTKLNISTASALRLIRSLSYLELNIYQDHRVLQSIYVVDALTNLHGKLHGEPLLKDAICKALCALLYPLAFFKFEDGTNYSSWFNLLSNLYDKMAVWGSREKHASIALPLMTVTLCVCEKEFFLSHYRTLTQNLLDLRTINKNLAIACLQLLVFVYLDKNASRKETTLHYIQQLCVPLFFDGYDPFPKSQNGAITFGETNHFFSFLIDKDLQFRPIVVDLKNNANASSAALHAFTNFTQVYSDRYAFRTLCSSPISHDLLLASALTMATSSLYFAIEHVVFGIFLSLPKNEIPCISPSILLAIKVITYILFSGSSAAELRLRDHRNMTHAKAVSLSEVEQLVLSDISTSGLSSFEETEFSDVSESNLKSDNLPTGNIDDFNLIHDVWKSWSPYIHCTTNSAYLYSDSFEHIRALYVASCIENPHQSNAFAPFRRSTFAPSQFASSKNVSIKGVSKSRSNTFGMAFQSPSQIILDLLLNLKNSINSLSSPDIASPKVQVNLETILSSPIYKKVQSLIRSCLISSTLWLSANTPYTCTNLIKNDTGGKAREKEWLTCSSIFQHCLMSLFHIWPDISNENAVLIVCQSALHLEANIGQAGIFVLRNFMQNKPAIRGLIISVLCKVIARLPDATQLIENYSVDEVSEFFEFSQTKGNYFSKSSNAIVMLQINRNALQFFNEMLSTYFTFLNSDIVDFLVENLHDFNLTEIQSSMFICLLSPDPFIRSCSWDCLKLVKKVALRMGYLAKKFHQNSNQVNTFWFDELSLVSDFIEKKNVDVVNSVLSRIDEFDSTLIKDISSEEINSVKLSSFSFSVDPNARFANESECSDKFKLWLNASSSSDQQFWSIYLAFSLSALKTVFPVIIEMASEEVYNRILGMLISSSCYSISDIDDGIYEVNEDSKEPENIQIPNLSPTSNFYLNSNFESIPLLSKNNYFTYPRVASKSVINGLFTSKTTDALESGSFSLLCHWRNLCVFASTCANHFNSAKLNSIFDKLIPLIGHEKPFIRSLIALGFTHDLSIQDLLTSLNSVEVNLRNSIRVANPAGAELRKRDSDLSVQSFINELGNWLGLQAESIICSSSIMNSVSQSEQILTSGNNSATKVIILWGEVAHIYRLLIEHMKFHRYELFYDESIKKRFLSFLHDSFQFLSQTNNEHRWDLFPLKIHFCVIVQHIAFLSAENSIIPVKSLYRRESTAIIIKIDDPLNQTIMSEGADEDPKARKSVLFQFDRSVLSPQSSKDKFLFSPKLKTPKATPRNSIMSRNSISNNKSPHLKALESDSPGQLDIDYRHKLFEFLLPWCGFGPSSSNYIQTILKHRSWVLNHLKENITKSRVESIFNLQQQTLSRQALLAMIALLNGPNFDSKTEMPTNPIVQGSRLRRMQSVGAFSEGGCFSLFSANSTLTKIVLPWLCDLGKTDSDSIPESIPSQALDCFLAHYSSFWLDFIHFCYSSNQIISRRFFLSFARFWKNTNNTNIPIATLISLIIHKLGDPCLEVRNTALDLLPLLLKRFPGKLSKDNFSFRSFYSGQLTDSYFQTQVTVSAYLLTEYNAHVHFVIAECTERYNEMVNIMATSEIDTGAPTSTTTLIRQLINSSFSIIELLALQRQMLRFLLPWFSKVKLTENRSDSFLVFSILTHLSFPWMKLDTSSFSSSLFTANNAFELISADVKAMWVEVGKRKTNIGFIMKHMILNLQGKSRQISDSISILIHSYPERRVSFLETIKRIALFLSSTSRKSTILSLIQLQRDDISSLEISDHNQNSESYAEKIPIPSLKGITHFSINAFQNNTIHNDVDTAEWHALKTEHWALILLVEVAFKFDFFSDSYLEIDKSFDKLDCNNNKYEEESFLIHVAIISADHSIPLVRKHVQGLFLHLLHSFLPSKHLFSTQDGTDENYNITISIIIALIKWLIESNCSPLWKNEVITESNVAVSSAKHVKEFTAYIVFIFSLAFELSVSNNIPSTPDVKSSPSPYYYNSFLKVARFVKSWINISLQWYTLSNDVHAICRSLQIFRVLWEWYNANILKASNFKQLSNDLGLLDDSFVLDRLSLLSISKNFSISSEAFICMQMITPSFSTNALLKSPRLLFNCIEILIDICAPGKFHSSLYMQILNALSLLFSNIPFHDKFVQNYYLKYQLKNVSILPLIIYGLKFSITREASATFLNLYTKFPWLLIWDCDSSNAVARAIVSQLPWLCFHLLEYPIAENIRVAAQNIEFVLQELQQNELALVFHKYHLHFYPTVWEFLSDLKVPFYTWISSFYDFKNFEIQLCLDVSQSISESTENFQHCVLFVLKLLLDNSHLDPVYFNNSVLDSDGSYSDMSVESPLKVLTNILVSLISLSYAGRHTLRVDNESSVTEALNLLWSSAFIKAGNHVGYEAFQTHSNFLSMHACHTLESLFIKSIGSKRKPSDIDFIIKKFSNKRPQIKLKEEEELMCLKHSSQVEQAPFDFYEFEKSIGNVNYIDSALLDNEPEEIDEEYDGECYDLEVEYYDSSSRPSVEADTINPSAPILEEEDLEYSDGRHSDYRLSMESMNGYSVRNSLASTNSAVASRLGLRNMMQRLSQPVVENGDSD